MKLAWMTDVHIDHLSLWGRERFFESLTDIDADALLVTGDISNGRAISSDLEHFYSGFKRPVYFVLGNHDYWHSSADKVRMEVATLTTTSGFELFHLNLVNHIKLSETTALVGHDTWYDALYGDWRAGNFRMLDWVFMEDYKELEAATWNRDGYVSNWEPQVVLGKSRAFAAEGVRHIEGGLKSAISAGFTNIVVASHVPPFDEAHVFQGKKGGDHAQPWFTCKMLGELLDKFAKENPNINFVSLSGHTHGKTTHEHSKNLVAHVGGARYEHPELQRIFEF